MTSAASASPLWAVRGAGALAVLAATLAGCAQPPSQHARRGGEFFSVARYGPASPRVVDDGEPVPRGGGQYLVGHPYTIDGRTYYPSENAHYAAVGLASWYGDAFHGRRTANGEVYDMRSLSAAHPTMPLPSYARVTNLGNGYSMIVRVNDRGPYAPGRIMDVSSRVADMLDFKSAGTAKVKVEYVGPAPLAGADDEIWSRACAPTASRRRLTGRRRARPWSPRPSRSNRRRSLARLSPNARARTARRSSPPPIAS